MPESPQTQQTTTQIEKSADQVTKEIAKDPSKQEGELKVSSDQTGTTAGNIKVDFEAFAKELGETPSFSAPEDFNKVKDSKKDESKDKKDTKEVARETTVTKEGEDNKGITSAADDKGNTASADATAQTGTTESKSGTSTAGNENTQTQEQPKEELEYVEAGKRDFSGLEENEIPLAKRMSNSAFNDYKAAKIELKEKRATTKRLTEQNSQLMQGRQPVPETFNQHPDAYLLTPEANQITREIGYHDSIAKHFEIQALNIAEGKDWQDLVPDGRGGLNVGAPQPATPIAGVRVNQAMISHTQKKGMAEGRLQNLAQTYQQEYKQSEQQIQSKAKEFFGYLDNEQHPARKTYVDILNMIPKNMRNHPLADLTARAITGALQFQNVIDQYKTGKIPVTATPANGNGTTQQTTTQQTQQVTRRDQGPSTSKINSGGGAGGSKTLQITKEMFQKEME